MNDTSYKTQQVTRRQKWKMTSNLSFDIENTQLLRQTTITLEEIISRFPGASKKKENDIRLHSGKTVKVEKQTPETHIRSLPLRKRNRMRSTLAKEK